MYAYAEEIVDEYDEPAEGHEGVYYTVSENIVASDSTSDICVPESAPVVVTQPVTTPKAEISSYTDEDILAGVIMGEARGEDALQKLYVGSVVLNRVTDPRFPNTINGVVTQPGQYASITKKGTFAVHPDAASYMAARRLLNEGSKLPANVVWQANFKQGTIYLKYGDIYYGY